LACSGSVSLELLYHLKPAVIHYRISRFAYFAQGFFRKVRFITLVNLLASDDRYCRRGETYDRRRDDVPFPEYLTSEDRTAEMAADLLSWLREPARYQATVERLRALKARFAGSGASRRAAEYLSAHLPSSCQVARTHYHPMRAA